MLGYIAADISSLLIQFQIFLTLVMRHPWIGLSSLQVVSLVIWTVGSWFVGVLVSVAIVTKFHELVFLESKTGVWSFYELFRPNRSRTAVAWNELFKALLGTRNEDTDALWENPDRVRRIGRGIDVAVIVCVLVLVLLLGINLGLLYG
jgi:hypothetical protein